MSRKFLDDNIELKLTQPTTGSLTITAMPKQSNKSYNRGHLVLDPTTSKRFVNEGNSAGSLFVNPDYNLLEIKETFTTVPRLVANETASKNISFALAGTNAADAGATFDTQGGLKMTTTTASADQLIITPNTNNFLGTVSIIADNSLVFETQIVTGSAITTATIWAGLKLTNASVTATDDDQAFFRYQNGVSSGNWQVIDSNNNTDNANDSGVAVAASTAYLLQVRISKGDYKPHYYINGKLVKIGNAIRTATALKPFVGVQTGTTAARNITCRFVRVLLPRIPVT